MVINDFVEGSQTIFSHTISCLKAGVEEKLTQHGIDIERIDGLQKLTDNLAAHLIGGFKQSMSFAPRLCVTCMATTEQIQPKFLESDFALRTPENHRKQCLEITSSAVLYGHLPTNCGINQSSVLDNVLNFSLNLPHDMRDMLEGVIPFELKLYLLHCVRHNYFTMTELIQSKRLFGYGINRSKQCNFRLLEG